MVESGALYELDDPFRFGDGTRQGFLAGDTAQRAATALEGIDDLLDVLYTPRLGPAIQRASMPGSATRSPIDA